MSFKPASALITGASSGIGRALASLLAEKNIPLFLTGRDKERLEELKEILSGKVPVEVFSADLSTIEGREQVVKVIKQRCPDLLVNNAGFGLYGPAIDLPIQGQLQVAQVDALALMEFTLTAAKELKERGRKGVIMNVSSAAAYQIFPYFSSYAAAKAFVVSLSKSIDFEVKESGIRVLVSCPGQVETDFSRRASGSSIKIARKNLVMTPEFAAAEIYAQIESGRGERIFDWKYRLMTMLSKIVPSWIAGNLLLRVVSARSRFGKKSL